MADARHGSCVGGGFVERQTFCRGKGFGEQGHTMGSFQVFLFDLRFCYCSGFEAVMGMETWVDPFSDMSTV